MRRYSGTIVHCDEKKCPNWVPHPEPIENWDGVCIAERVSVLSGVCVKYRTDNITREFLKENQKQKRIDIVTWERGLYGARKRKERKSVGKPKPKRKKVRDDEELRTLLL